MRTMKNREARRESNPSPKKIPKSPSVSTQNQKLVWKVSHIDESGEWGWDKIDCPSFLKTIWEKMRDFETMKWAEILGRLHHTVAVNDIITHAQKRLRKLEYDDHDELVSFRIGGKQRIWGIQSGANCYLLWWDPKHQITTSTKKHT